MNIVNILKFVIQNFLSSHAKPMKNYDFSKLVRLLEDYVSVGDEINFHIKCLNNKRYHLKSKMIPKDVNDIIYVELNLIDYDINIILEYIGTARGWVINIEN